MGSKTNYIVIAVALVAMGSAFVVAAQTGEGPYVQAIRVVKALGDGPDGRRIDPSGPLNAGPAAFLYRNLGVLDLVHAGAVAHSTDWGVGSGDGVDMQTALDQLNGVRALANLDVLRGREKCGEGDYAGGEQDFLDALALGRNVEHRDPILVVELVGSGIERTVLIHWASLLPKTPADQLAGLADRVKQLPEGP